MLSTISTLACTSGPDGIAGFFLIMMAIVVWVFICVLSLFG